MVISDTLSMIDGFTIALLMAEFGQVWTKLGLQKSRTTLGEIVGLHNCAVADKGSIDKAGITKIAYNFRRDRRTAQLCSCRQRHSCGMTSHHSKG